MKLVPDVLAIYWWQRADPARPEINLTTPGSVPRVSRRAGHVRDRSILIGAR
jgi:hypothetical protein